METIKIEKEFEKPLDKESLFCIIISVRCRGQI